MKHISEVDCINYANQAGIPERTSEVEGHLWKGCAKCQKELDFWRKVKEIAGREAETEPMQEAVRMAIGTFAICGPRPGVGILREVAQLVFDSFREPGLAGVRSGHGPSRRLMFRAGEVMIDLSMESANRRSHVMLVGQVLDTATSGAGIGEVPVLLLNGRETLAKTRTNMFGEFQMECAENKNLQISVGVTVNKDVFIPLDETIWKTPVEYRFSDPSVVERP
jgi:hypothetical protein